MGWFGVIQSIYEYELTKTSAGGIKLWELTKLWRVCRNYPPRCKAVLSRWGSSLIFFENRGGKGFDPQTRDSNVCWLDINTCEYYVVFDVWNISADNDRTGYNNQTSSYNGWKLQLKDMVAIRLGFCLQVAICQQWFDFLLHLSLVPGYLVFLAQVEKQLPKHIQTLTFHKRIFKLYKIQRIEKQMQGYPDMLSSLYVRLRKVTNVFREPLWAVTQTSVLQQIYPVVLPTTLSNLKLIYISTVPCPTSIVCRFKKN